METQDTLTEIAEEIGKVFLPLHDALQSPSTFVAFMRKLGWDFTAPIDIFNQIKPVLQVLKNMLATQDFNSSTVVQLTGQIKNVIIAIKNIASASVASFPSSVDAQLFKDEFPEQLLQYLMVEYLLNTHPKIGGIFQSVGIIRITEVAASGKRLSYSKKEIVFSYLATLFTNPTAVFKTAFKWGDASFKTQDFRNAISKLGHSLDFPFHEEVLNPKLEALFNKDISNPADYVSLAFKIILLEDHNGDPNYQVGIAFQTLPKAGSALPGFAIIPFASGSIDEIIALNNHIKLLVELGFNTSSGVAVLVRPDNLQIKTNIIGSASGENPPSAFKLKLGLEYEDADGKPTILLGKPDESRLEFLNYVANLGVKITENNKADLFLENEIKGGKLVIKAGKNDGFLNAILPKDGLQGTFDLTLGWSSKHGIYFEGSGGLEIALPVHINLALIEINGITIAVKPNANGIPIELGANFKANLGPLMAMVENIGIKSTFSFPSDNSGNLGPINYAMDFKPPNGVALSVDAGVVKGGGYLKLDYDKGEYAGALELTFSEIVSLKAIGIINTKMPDGSPGFSLIIIITAEFGAGIQLGFGFTLLGVGGLIGLNRTMRKEALAEGVRSGAVEGIMFPTNIVENAPRIISDLKLFFPIYQGKFLIGPMAKLGWGTPTLISISLGIIIEIPGDIVILGILKIALPTEDAALIVLQVNFIGAIEFDKERLWFFASMYDSRVLFITLEGEMGLLVGWGSESNFVASVGGFHPAFNPPPLPFPSPVRISMSLLNESYAKIRVMGYFAVTSNTAQFGASAELYFGFKALRVEGHIGFDALFQFSPFYVIIQLSASLSVKVFGAGLFSVRVKMRLEGPTPWIAHGTGSISLLLFDVDVDIDVTWGERKNITLPPISIMPLLIAEFEKQENWKALIPANCNLLVTLRKIEDSEALVLHPLGSLQLTQRAIPLNMILDKLGSQKPDDANLFTVEPANDELSKIKTLQEKFAIAQFKNLKDAEKLSSPSYQNIEAGLELSINGKQFNTGKTVKRHVRYELITIDSNYKRNALKFFTFFSSLFVNFLGGNTVSRSDISFSTAKKLQPFDEIISIKDTGFAVATASNNKVFGSIKNFSSHAQAKDYLAAQIAKNPELQGELHVLPNHEINPAA